MSNHARDSSTDSGKPVIFVLTLGDEHAQITFQESHARFLNELFERASVWNARTAEKAFSLFTQCAEPHAVFVADGGIARPKCEVISQRLVQYASRGGIVVFGGSFAASGSQSLDKILRQTWDLPWEISSVHRATVSLNSGAVSTTLREKLSASYSQEALYIRRIEPCEAWYLPTEPPAMEGWVPVTRPAVDSNDSPIVFAQYGAGHIGFVGDVEPEDGSIIAMLAMLGLLAD
ncbi:hypothetical protein HDV57DRAFT_81745 [Trichoderma longibrachiatum]|uniref:ThuA-like domain-containing protein n=1 Tax=Trichoderma longibrachiatum ATCC 18648 TaxID=983965 RepID=A0A2T4CEN1_TRILO|nr:hypothetical protein M440DRAFT_1325298 [Trichoderma longibrachiatum ATCC 18648]